MSSHNPGDIKSIIGEVSSEMLGDCAQYSRYLQRIEEVLGQENSTLSNSDRVMLLNLQESVLRAKTFLLKEAKAILPKERPKLKIIF